MASATERAIRRLEAALSLLEQAVQPHGPSGGPDVPSAEVEMLTADRARLAETLDHSQARVARLEAVNREASRRIAQSVESIRAVLGPLSDGR